MATTTNQLTWEAFEQLPDDGSQRFELIDGELQSLPPLTLRHCEISRRAASALMVIEEQGRGRVYGLAGYKLSHDPPTWIRPDVSFLSRRRVADADPGGYLLGAPELAVEVISPSESAVDVDRKVDLLLAHGGQVVWVIYPKIQTMRVFLTDGSASLRGLNDSLTLPGILPGWTLPVAQLFENE